MISTKTKHKSFMFMPKFTVFLGTGTTDVTEIDRNIFIK